MKALLPSYELKVTWTHKYLPAFMAPKCVLLNSQESVTGYCSSTWIQSTSSNLI